MASALITPQRRRQDLPSVVGPVLDALTTPAVAEGAAVVALEGRDGKPTALCETRQGPAALLDATHLLSSGAYAPAHGLCPDRHPVLAGPWQTPRGKRAVVVFWREKGAQPWKKQDHSLVLMAAAALGAVLKHVAPPSRETRWRNAADSLTGLPKARKFVTDLPRHFARLDRDGLPGTLLLLSIDEFRHLNNRFGRKAGEAMLSETAELLYRMTRPTDVIARIGPDEFALWLNGADHFAAAERAEQIRLAAPSVLAAALAERDVATSLSIGIVARYPGSAETVEGLMCRADFALHEAKRAGPGLWRVSHEEVG